MDDNSMSNSNSEEQRKTEKNEYLEPQNGNIKLKLDDNNSRNDFKDLASGSEEKDENVDSGVSADKSESTSSDEPGPSLGFFRQDGPSNVLIDAAPSSSNIHTILLNIKRPTGGRNYRRRNTPDRDTESNNSSRDSDDLTIEEDAASGREFNESSDDTEPEVKIRRLLSNPSDSEFSSYNSSESDNDTNPWVNMNDDDDDDDDEGLDEGLDEVNANATPEVLLKTQPKHNWFALREIINREMGLTYPFGKKSKNDAHFERRFYSSLHSIYRLQRLHKLNKHRGCVNAINFHPEGHILVSGSDDLNIIIWDWAKKVHLQTIKTGHKGNVFQSKFLYLNAKSQLNIATSARDGQVRLITCPPSGGGAVKRRLMSHSQAVHKLYVSPMEPHRIISAGEDGDVMHTDVRAEKGAKLFSVKSKENKSIALYSIDGHPLDQTKYVVAGRDVCVRVYDSRNTSVPHAFYCPTILRDKLVSGKKKMRMSQMSLTCAVYNHNGTEILGSYNDDDVYLFDTAADVLDEDKTKEGYTHKYSGHRNSNTIKGVSFFGPNSEYVVSGSDCSYIYIWEKKSEAIVQWLFGDNGGVVNCIETHPRYPVMASSGLDKDIKIWMPILNKDPEYVGMEKTIRDNCSPQLRHPLFNDFLPTIYSAWRSERLFSDGDSNSSPTFGGNIEFDGNVCTTF